MKRSGSTSGTPPDRGENETYRHARCRCDRQLAGFTCVIASPTLAAVPPLNWSTKS